MNNTTLSWKKWLPDVVCVLAFMLISFVYFMKPMSEGLVLGGHDAVASVGQGRELMDHVERTGEYTRWTNTLFSGMPTYQIAPSYKSSDVLSTLSRIYGLGTASAFCYVFMFLLGFYILLRAFNFRPWLAMLGSVLWAFSSYFFIIISAGHIWKVLTLTFIPPTIGGMVLCYRGKWLWGGAVTALFTALQIHANHVQMSYYFLPLMIFIAVAYLVDAVVRKKTASWAKATGVVLLAGILGIAANVPNLYHTYEYSKLSLRGASELTPSKANAAKATDGGLDRDYITQWSYGIDESMTFLIPDFKGGGSGSLMAQEELQELPEFMTFYQCAASADQYIREKGAEMWDNGQAPTPPGLNQYWGDQPFTVGPVYVGAFVCLLFIFGIFFVRGPMKWALLAATIISFLMGWGHNDAWFTNFCIDHLPMYNKFRTPSSALVVAEFTIPLLAILALVRIIREPKAVLGTLEGKIGLGVSVALTIGVCLLLWLVPSMAGNCLSAQDESLLQALSGPLGSDFTTTYAEAISALHYHILSASAGRSLVVLLLGAACVAYYVLRNKEENVWYGATLCTALLAICLVDMWQVNKKYLNDESFTDPVVLQNPAPTPADQVVLQDKTDYRVLSVAEGSPFNETSNHTAFFHQSIGGYNAAKLHRYQDIIDHQLQQEMPPFLGYISEEQGDMTKVPGDSLAPVINMLNTKYVVFGDKAIQVVQNPYANGNGWFVQKLDFVKNADEEMFALHGLDTKHAAVADEKFRSMLEGTPLDSGTVVLKQRTANELTYEISSPKGGLAVLSEVYYPGWTATIDGKPAEVGRVNYILRALKIPAGKHDVVMTFRPTTVTTTEVIAFVAIALIILGFLAALFLTLRKKKSE